MNGLLAWVKNEVYTYLFTIRCLIKNNTEVIINLSVLSYNIIILCWFHSAFNNISAILLRKVSLVDETGVHTKNHQPVASQRESLTQIVVSSTP